MDHLFAKEKGRLGHYSKLLSAKSIYQLPDNLDSAVEYAASYKLEDGEWYVIRDFSNRDFFLEILKNPINSCDFPTIGSDAVENLEYICSYQNRNEFYFQRIFKSRVLRKHRIIDFSKEMKIHETGEGIIINSVPDALYVRSIDTLYFQKLETISPIFKGIEKLYREATKEEVENFLSKKFIRLTGDYDASKVGKANRHRLAMANDTLRSLNKDQKGKLFKYTNQYYPGLEYDGKSFSIGSEEDLKNLLFGIEQRYYTTPVTKEKRVANSVKTIE